MTSQPPEAESVDRAKQLVWPAITAGAVPPVDVFAPDIEFHGPSPVGNVTGVNAMVERFYRPIDNAFPRGQHHHYLFLGGSWHGGVWVAATGYLHGQRRRSLFGVPLPIKRDAHGESQPGEEVLRFGQFHRVEDGVIVESRVLIDLLGMAARAGYPLLPPFDGDGANPAGPVAGNGVVRGRSDPEETADTLRLVEDMLGGCNRLVDGQLQSMGMDVYWHPDMVWYGPWGVGTARGFDQFQRFAQGPSVASFPNRRGGFHQARFADGMVAAFTGWPSLQGVFDGEPFRGINPTGGPIGQNIMDFYVRRGDRLAENWVLIDLIDFAAQCGVDLLEKLPTTDD